MALFLFSHFQIFNEVSNMNNKKMKSCDFEAPSRNQSILPEEIENRQKAWMSLKLRLINIEKIKQSFRK